MKNYDAIVIGAGNGGLVASARLAKEGKKTLLIERHNLPGGFVPPKIEQLTGITTQDLREKGLPKTRVCRDIAEMIQGNTLLLAYNAHFDLSFLFYMLLRNGAPAILKGKDKVDLLTVYKDRHSYPHKLCNAIDVYGLSDKVCAEQFGNMLSSPAVTVGFMAIVVVLGFLILSFGLQKGVESVTKYMMLALLCLMLILAVGYIAVAVTQSLSGIMRGAGDTMTPMWISLITTVAVRVPIAYGISFLTRTAELPYGQKECIQISLVSSWVIGALLTLLFYRIGKWKKKAIQ